jgi:ribosomal protein L12E/L44/L45/RPP1/RPP2
MKTKRNENLTEDVTIEEARAFECCKDLNDEQIKELLENIRIFTEIAYSAYAKKKEEQENDELPG